MRITQALFFAAVLLGAGVLQAHAFDMTGTWKGKWTCRVQENGTPITIANNASIMKITQIGSSVHVDLDGGEFLYNGWAGADNDNADRGATTVVECRTKPRSANYNEIISAEVKAPSGAGGGQFNGTSAYNSTDVSTPLGCSPLDPRCASTFDSTDTVNTDIGGICRYTFKRVSSTDPGVGPCPPQG